MPLYEYLCESCGERAEILQRISDSPEAACPNCGKAMRRLPSAPAIQFKGSGFYLTDYAKKSGGTEGTSQRASVDKGSERSEKGGEGATKSDSTASASASAPAAPAATTSPAAPAGGASKSGSGSSGA